MDDNEYPLNMKLSEEESQTLTEMIHELQEDQESKTGKPVPLEQEVEALKEQMAYLGNLCIAIERNMKPLQEIMHLALEKCEILNQRVNTIIESIRSGEPL